MRSPPWNRPEPAAGALACQRRVGSRSDRLARLRLRAVIVRGAFQRMAVELAVHFGRLSLLAIAALALLGAGLVAALLVLALALLLRLAHRVQDAEIVLGVLEIAL